MNEKKDRQSVAYIIFLIGITAVLVLFSCKRIITLICEPEIILEENTAVSQRSAEESQKEASSILQQMSLHDKICQMFIVTPEALSGGTNETECSSGMLVNLGQYPVGGVILFSRNIIDRDQTSAMLKELQEASVIGLFAAVDEEGGNVSRVGSNPNMKVAAFPDMHYIGESGDTARAKNVGYLIGKDLLRLGFNLDFAPVADVNCNIQNSVIGTRAFSSDPQVAAEMVAACVDGFQQSGVLCTLKHFPGHGDASADSHNGTAIVNKSLEELENCELIPFVAGIDAGAPLVMVGHITCPALDGEKPASLSKAVVTTLLREKMGYSGLIVTDSLQMAAATNYEMDGRCAALQAVEAGCDLLLMPENLEAAVNQIVVAVQNGEIQENRIDESVLRILTVKVQKGIMD